MNSPKEIARALYFSHTSKLFRLYRAAARSAEALQTLLTVSRLHEQQPTFSLINGPTHQYHGTLPLNGAATYAAIFRAPEGHVARSTFIVCTYVITNSITGSCYVGSTEDFYRRWTSHANLLRRGKHTNARLQADVTEYGIENFTIAIIATYANTTGLLDREEQAAKLFDPRQLLNYKVGNKWAGLEALTTGPKADRTPTINPRGSNSKLRWYDYN